MQTDVEGFDAQVLLSLDLVRFRPRAITFEDIHLPDGDQGQLDDYLRANRYHVFKFDDENSAAIRTD